MLQCPVQLLYPLEINYQPRSDDDQDDASTSTTAGSLIDHVTDDAANQETKSHPQKAAAVKACSCTCVPIWITD